MKKPKKKRSSGPPQALDRIRVLDLSRSVAGAAATMLLANFGAEVIKIEPSGGDPARKSEPQVHGESAVFYLFNRGKKSVTLDANKKADQKQIQELVATADVFIESERPGVLKKFGLHYEALAKINPKLVYVSVTGYGQDGPYASVAGHDINYIGLGGAIELLGAADGPPTLPGIPLGEIAGGGLQAAIGTLLALQARERTGAGQLVDVAMLDGILGLLSMSLATFAATNRRPQRSNERLSGELACYNLYPARDGRWITVGALDPPYWKNLCEAIDREDLIADQYAPGDRQAVLKAELTRIFQRKTTQEWMEIFADKDCCVSPVRDVVEATRDEHLLDRQTIVGIHHPEGGTHLHLGVFPKLSATPGKLGTNPPAPGEDNDEVLEGKKAVERAKASVQRREVKTEDADAGRRGPGRKRAAAVSATKARAAAPKAPAAKAAAPAPKAKAAHKAPAPVKAKSAKVAAPEKKAVKKAVKPAASKKAAAPKAATRKKAAVKKSVSAKAAKPAAKKAATKPAARKAAPKPAAKKAVAKKAAPKQSSAKPAPAPKKAAKKSAKKAVPKAAPKAKAAAKAKAAKSGGKSRRR